MTLRAFGNYKPPKRDVNFVFLDGGLGDHIGGSLIAVKYVIDRYKWVTPHVWVPDFMHEFCVAVLPRHTIIRPLSLMKEKFKKEFFTKSTLWDGVISPLKMHCVDYAFLKLCDERNVSDVDKNYPIFDCSAFNPSDFKLPGKYVAFGVGFTADVREFRGTTLNELAGYVKERGYTPVFLGQRESKTGVKHTIKMRMRSDVDLSLGIDLINQTSLTQATQVIGHAAAFVGVDCGLMHLAGCTPTPIVAGFTTVAPELRMPYRNGIMGWRVWPVRPNSDLVCKYCQSSTNFLFDHDYRFCMYGDYQCVDQMTPDKFIAALDTIL